VGVRVTVGVSIGVGVGGSVENRNPQRLSVFQENLGRVLRITEKH
jgi:hypothetical protein